MSSYKYIQWLSFKVCGRVRKDIKTYFLQHHTYHYNINGLVYIIVLHRNNGDGRIFVEGTAYIFSSAEVQQTEESPPFFLYLFIYFFEKKKKGATFFHQHCRLAEGYGRCLGIDIVLYYIYEIRYCQHRIQSARLFLTCYAFRGPYPIYLSSASSFSQPHSFCQVTLTVPGSAELQQRSIPAILVSIYQERAVSPRHSFPSHTDVT